MHFTRQPLIYQLFSTIFSQLLFHRPIVQTQYKMDFQPGAQKSVNVSILEKTYIQYLITRTFFKTQNKLK